MQLQGRPSLNVVYSEPGCTVYFVDVGDGTLTIHVLIEGKVTLSRLKHWQKIWADLQLVMLGRGMDHIDAWIEFDDDKQWRFASFFGFELTGFLKELYLNTGQTKIMEEMRYEIPQGV